VSQVTPKQRKEAMQKLRPIVCKILDETLEKAKEGLEDAAIDCLVEAGIDMPLDPDADAAGVDEAIGLTEKALDDAIHHWLGSRLGPVWAVLGFDEENGVRGLEVEFFSRRPQTYNDPSNWPKWFRVYEGNLDGGDSIICDSRGANFG
jgi:hypothetical protein